jgi:hypothetical protein
VDGKTLAYNQLFFEGQDPNEQSNVTFFPIIKKPGSTYIVTMSAIDSGDGRKISITRNFKVVNPLAIIDADEANRIAIGSYIRTDGTEEIDYSRTTFQADQLSSVTFTRHLYPSYIADSITQAAWLVDGIDPTNVNPPLGYTPATVAADAASVSIPINKLPGDSYNVSFTALYSADPALKPILNRVWGIGFNQIASFPLSTTVDLKVAIPTATAENTGPKKFLATLSSGLPSYISFLFRIVLTAALLLLGTHIIFSFLPSSIENDEKNYE